MRRGAMVLGLVLVGWGVLSTGAAEAQKIQIGLEFINSRSSVLWVCQEQGFFSKEGLDVEVIPIRGGTAGVQAITSGQIQFSLSATAAIIPAIAAGSDVVELANIEPVAAYLLVVSKGIKSAAELKGKRFGVSGLGLSNSSLGARVALKHFGLDPTRDQIALTAVGTETERVLAVVSGAVAGSVLAPELQAKAEQAGAQVLADLRTLGIPWAGSNVVTTRRTLQTNRETVDRVLRALLRSIAFIRDPQNKAAVLRVLKEKANVEEAAFEPTYRDLLNYYLVPKPYSKPESAQFMIREAYAFLAQIGKLKPEDVMAPEPLRALDQSGWIDGLYRTGAR